MAADLFSSHMLTFSQDEHESDAASRFQAFVGIGNKTDFAVEKKT